MDLDNQASTSCDKPYYSLLSSISMLFLSVYLIYQEKNIGYLSILVSIFSILHHYRSYSKSGPDGTHGTDIIQLIDIFLTLCLGIVLFRIDHYNRVYIGLIIVLYFCIISIFSDSPHKQSLLHMIIHVILMHMLSNELYKTTSNRKKSLKHRIKNKPLVKKKK